MGRQRALTNRRFRLTVSAVLFLRAVLSFLILPGMVAFAIPLVFLGGLYHPFHKDGLWLVVPGTILLVECVREFYVRGKGTLAPWDPPRHLVTDDLYRWSRNPMYVGVLLVLCGWAVGYRSVVLGVYAALTFLLFHARVVRYEEPTLARLFPSEWPLYKSRVRRWI